MSKGHLSISQLTSKISQPSSKRKGKSVREGKKKLPIFSLFNSVLLYAALFTLYVIIIPFMYSSESFFFSHPTPVWTLLKTFQFNAATGESAGTKHVCEISFTSLSAHSGWRIVLQPRIHMNIQRKERIKNLPFFLCFSLCFSYSKLLERGGTFLRLFQWNSTWEIPSFDTLTALVCVVQDNQWILEQSRTCNYKGN